MKMKQKKSVHKRWTIGVAGLLALGIGLGPSVHGAETSAKKVPSMQYEMVPHVVLPETIQYKPVAKNIQNPTCDYGIASPLVATYTPFPSYQLPFPTEMKPVGKSVYPVSPKMPARLLPLQTNAAEESLEEPLSFDALTKEEMDSPVRDKDVAPILLAAGYEEIVPAAPLSAFDNDITQTGIFCQKSKVPTATSFTSPLLKYASVPMGNGYISQMGPHGCVSQVGMNPMMGGMGGGMDPSMGGMGMMPMNTSAFQMGRGVNGGGGPQFQQLPNGMLLMSMPPDHRGCGLLRCRCGNSPQYMLLPGAPGGMMPGMAPQPIQPPATDPNAMMMPGMMPGMMGGMMGGMQPQMMSPQMMPVTAMTPYGMTVVGYRPMPMMNPMMGGGMPNMGMPGMGMSGMGMGYGMMPIQYAQQIIQQQQLQLAQQQQILAAMQQGKSPAETSSSTGFAEGKDENGQELKAPLPINGQAQQGMPGFGIQGFGGMPGMMASPYSPYAQQYAQLVAQANGQATQDGTATAEAVNGMNPPAMNPMMMGGMPGMMPMNPMAQMNPYAGVYMTPFGMMVMNPAMPRMGMGGYGTGYGMMDPSMMMNVGMGGMMGAPAMGQGGLTVADMVQLLSIMNQNQRPRRMGLFARIAERRQARRESRNGHNDPFQAMTAAWQTPYYPAETAMRMPSRVAYPYGYFGAQVGPQETANYGGMYNLYMGNTTYPGLY